MRTHVRTHKRTHVCIVRTHSVVRIVRTHSVRIDTTHNVRINTSTVRVVRAHVRTHAYAQCAYACVRTNVSTCVFFFHEL